MRVTVSIPEALAYGEDEPLPSTGKAQPDVLVAVANMLKGKVKGPIPDFFEPMSEEDLKLWEGGE